jgi:hypothetical protein
VKYRLIGKEKDCCSNIEVLKSKVRQNLMNAEVYILKQHFDISGYEKLKYYLKLRKDDKAFEVIKNLKSEDSLMRRILHKKPAL